MKKSSKLLFVMCAVLCSLCIGVFMLACGQGDDGQKVTISFDSAGGSAVTSITAEPGSNIYPPEDPTRDGYRFDGWLLNGNEFVFNKMPETDTRLTAAWTKIYTITFDSDGGSSVAPVRFAEGETIVLPDPPTMDGHKFDGWTQDDAAFTATTMPANDISLKATWKEARTITFNTGVAGVAVAPLVEEAGAEITAPRVDRDGYHVKRWLNGSQPYVFFKMPDENITLTAEWEKLSNLPAVFVDLKDKNGNRVNLSDVDRVNYIKKTNVTITNTDEEYRITEAAAEFRGRGNGSWTDIPYDKKGYRIKFKDKTPVFGETKNKHWVLLAGVNFDDPTMSRNYLAYNMARELFDGIEYTTSARWVDFYVNGDYRGVYLLAEQVRVDKGRVDITSEYGVSDTGYLVEYDAYATVSKPGEDAKELGIDYFTVSVPGIVHPFTVKSPDPDDYLEETTPSGDPMTKRLFQDQVAAIRDSVQNVCSAAINHNWTTFSTLCDVDSFVDMYILHELFKNVDTGYSSFYLYKDAGANSKVFAGPPWDFDATTNFVNADTSNERGDRGPNGIYVASPTRSDAMVNKLFVELYNNTPQFKAAVKARWKTLSPQISAFIAERMSDTVIAQNKAAMGRNYSHWLNKTQTVAEADWATAMNTLKTWFTNRIAWLDDEWR